MRKQSLFAAVAAIALVGFVACYGGDDPIGPDAEFSATMTGAAAGVATDATGTATFDLNGGVMSFALNVADITGVVAAHIHGPADASQNAGVIVGLFGGPETGAVNGELVSGTFVGADITATNVDMDSLLVLMGNGNAYVNVHTVENPGGEIRGQIQAD